MIELDPDKEVIAKRSGKTRVMNSCALEVCYIDSKFSIYKFWKRRKRARSCCIKNLYESDGSDDPHNLDIIESRCDPSHRVNLKNEWLKLNLSLSLFDSQNTYDE